MTLIGCSPSSGSSFLADLLDSLPDSVCGAELGLFSNKKFYDYDYFSNYPLSTSPSSSIYWLLNGVYKNALKHYGITREQLIKIAKSNHDHTAFIDEFFHLFRIYRDKQDAVHWFEKTPLNTNTMYEYLDTFKEGKFVYMVRDPLYVFASLRRRGFGKLIAATNWLLEMANYARCRNHENVIVIKYEDFVLDPFRQVADLVSRINGNEVDLELLKYNYENNNYRKSLGRQKSWNINQYGKVGDANRKKITSDLINDFTQYAGVKIAGDYANLFSLDTLSMADAIMLGGYKPEKAGTGKSSDQGGLYTFKDRYRLARKWAGDYISNNTDMARLHTYLNPIEKA